MYVANWVFERAYERQYQAQEVAARDSVPNGSGRSAVATVEPTTPAVTPVVTRPPQQTWSWPAICDRIIGQCEQGLSEIAIQLQTLSRQQGWQGIGFASHTRGAGRTTVLLTLARLLQRQQVRTLLLDGDLEHPQLSELLQVATPGGWPAVIEQRVTLDMALQVDPAGWLSLLSGRSARNPMAQPYAHAFWGTVRQRFELILIDLPPGTTVNENLWLGLDAVLTVSSPRWQPVPQDVEFPKPAARAYPPAALGIIETFA